MGKENAEKNMGGSRRWSKLRVCDARGVTNDGEDKNTNDSIRK